MGLFSGVTDLIGKETGLWGKEGTYDPYGAYNPEQTALNKTVGTRLNTMVGEGPQYYTGELSAEMSPEEAAYYNPTRANLMSGTIDQMMQEGYNDTAFNNQFQQEMVDPTYQQFRNYTQPTLEEALPTFSTARGTVLARELGTVGQNLLQQRFTSREAAKNRALSAYGAVPAVQSYLETPRVFKQAGLDRKYADYIQANTQAAQNIDKALAFLGIGSKTYTPPDYSFRDFLLSAGQIAAGAFTGGKAKAAVD